MVALRGGSRLVAMTTMRLWSGFLGGHVRCGGVGCGCARDEIHDAAMLGSDLPVGWSLMVCTVHHHPMCRTPMVA
jgi:hypothetical protein